MSHGRDLSAMMRGMLLQNGIRIDDPEPPRRATPSTASQAEAVDPEAVRAVLVELGATEDELAWLVPSCPSLEHARTWQRPGMSAYMAPEQLEQPAEPVASAAPTVGYPKAAGYPKVQR